MATKLEILAELDRLSSLKDMIESYEEIAASKMRKIRDSVLKTRDFLSEVNDIFHQVQSSYYDEVRRIMRAKRIKDPSKVTFLKKNGKTVYVLLSANTGLYGAIIKSTFNLFLEGLQKEKCDAVIVGRIGMTLLEEQKVNNKVEYFELPDNKIDHDILSKIVNYILQYEKIVVFHGQFQTVITQKATSTNISENRTIESEDNAQEKNKIKYLFEPSLDKIMAFFEKEIFASIFEQTVHESELAKFSSRMLVLDQSIENIRERIKKVFLEKQRLKHRAGNRKQLARLTGMSLWLNRI